MNRRAALETITIIGLPLSPMISPNKGSNEWKIIEAFKERFESIQLYAQEILDAMPEQGMVFKPISEMMSFGKLFNHLIGGGLNGYANVLAGIETTEEPDNEQKLLLKAFIDKGFDNFQQALSSLEGKDLFSKSHHNPDKAPWDSMKSFDIMMLAYSHTTHHLAQATIYLRLQGITPPKYRF